MNLFAYTKYFFDVFSGRKDYLVMFISIIRTGSFTSSYLQICFREAGPSGNYLPLVNFKCRLKLTGITPEKIIFREGTIDTGESFKRLSLKVAGLSAGLDYRGSIPGIGECNPFTIQTGKNTLSWRPLILKGTVDGKIILPDRLVKFANAPGYADEVKTFSIPYKFRIRSLMWGRLHHDKADLAYSVLIGEGNRADAELFLNFRGKIFEIRNITIGTSGEKINNDLKIFYPVRVILAGSATGVSVQVEISVNKELLLNDFMDPSGQYNKLFAPVVRLISQDPKGIKFLSSANLVINDGLEKTYLAEIPMISEFVRFGGKN